MHDVRFEFAWDRAANLKIPDATVQVIAAARAWPPHCVCVREQAEVTHDVAETSDLHVAEDRLYILQVKSVEIYRVRHAKFRRGVDTETPCSQHTAAWPQLERG